jgi:hypothetical protein
MADTALAEPPAAPTARPESKLDDVMLAMDVVDTLRHQDMLVAQELDEDQREAQLIERLREIYKAQGIPVTDAILKEGVRALKEARFTYVPAPPGMARTLATLWVERGLWGKRVLAAVVALAIGLGTYQYVVIGGAARRAEALRVEFSETLPGQLNRLNQAIAAEARVQPARDQAAALKRDAETAIAGKDGPAARKAIAGLDQLLGKLRQEYTLKIVSRPNEQTGFYRNPPSGSARNYYLVVQPIGPDGNPIKLPVTSEEDQKTTLTDRFGVRVSEQVYNRVRDDKRDDGIVQQSTLGVKKRGELEPTWSMPVAGGYVTQW